MRFEILASLLAYQVNSQSVGYLYTEEAVEAMGEPCLEESKIGGHELSVRENVEVDGVKWAKIWDISVEPGILCYFQSHISFVIVPDDEEGEKDALNVWYFVYEGTDNNNISGIKSYLEGKETEGVCTFKK